MSTRLKRLSALTGAVLLSGPVLAQTADQELRQEIEAIKQQNAILAERLDATASAMEDTAGPDRVNIGGYGELHYNNLDDKKEIDFHRFVLFFGHRFTDTIRFHSELEIEHALAGDGKPGEVEVEQAYIEMDLSPNIAAKAGLFLIPVGIINETHEPPTFYGVERNPVESNIIPATWWAGGAALTGRFGLGWSYDLAIHEGLLVDAPDFAIRGGRQKTAEAAADDLAYTGRLKWTGMPGVELAATVHHQSDITQGTVANAGSATLLEAHGILERGPFGLRALYATWDLDGDGPAASGADEQSGWYVEPSVKLNPTFGVFARYADWDNQAGSAADTAKDQTNVGFNYWPHPDVVLKADWQDHSDAGSDGFNLGVGYQF